MAERLKKSFSSTQNGPSNASKAKEQRFAVASAVVCTTLMRHSWLDVES